MTIPDFAPALDPIQGSMESQRGGKMTNYYWLRPNDSLPKSTRYICSACRGICYDMTRPLGKCSYAYCPRCGKPILKNVDNVLLEVK